MALLSSLKSRILGISPTFDPALQEQMQRKGLFDIEGKPITDPIAIRKVLATRKELGMEEKTVLRPGPTRALVSLPEKEPVLFTGITPEGKPEELERISEPAQRRLAIEEQVEKGRRFEEARAKTPLERTAIVLKGAGLIAEEIARIPQKLVTAPALDIAAGVTRLIKGKEEKAELAPREGSLIDRILIGREPLKGFTAREEKTEEITKKASEAIGFSPETARFHSTILAPFFVAGSVALDVTPIGAGKKALQQAAKEASLLKNADEILPILHRVFKGSDDALRPLAESLVPIENADDALKLIQATMKKKISPVDVKQVFRPEKFDLTPEETTRLTGQFKEAGLEIRTVKPTEQMIEEARNLRPHDVIIKKGPLTDAEVISLRSHVRNLSKELTDAIVKKEDLKIDLLHEEIQASVKKLTTGGTASGRSVYAYKLMAQDSFDPAFWMRRAQKAFGIDDLPKNVTEKINGFIAKKDATSLVQYIANLEQSSWLSKLVTLRTAGLLTGIPKTDLKNIGSNIVLKNLEDIADLSTTKAWDALAGLFTGKRTTRVTFGDILQSWGKFNEGARAGLELLRTGKDLSKFTGEKIVYKQAFNKFSDNPIERGLSRYTDLIFQRLEAEDKPFKAMAYAKYLLEQARVEGMGKGLRGVGLEKFMDDFIAKPTKELTEQAIQYSRYLTLQTDNWMNDLWKAAGRFTKQLEAKALTGEFKNKVSRRMAIELYSLPSFAMQMISPFNRVATNLFLRPLEFSPAGFLNAISKGVKGDQAGFAKSAGRATLGTLILGGLYTLFTEGGAKFESAELDENKKINQLKRRVGKSVYDSITFRGIDGKEWNIEFSGIDPLPKLFLMTGFAQKVAQGKMTTTEALEHLASSMLDQTYTTGLQDILGLSVFGGYRDLNNYIGRQGASFVPTMVYNVAKILDDGWKLNDGIIENTMNKIPILKGELPPRFDVFGRSAKMDKNPFLRTFNEAISPIKIKQVEYNPIDRELERLYNMGFEEVLPSEPQKYLRVGDTKIDFTSKELSRIQKERGRNVWEELRNLFRDREYQQANDTEKSDLIQSKYRDVLKSIKEKTILNIVRSRDIDHTDKLNFILQVDVELGRQYLNRYRSQINLGRLSKTARKKVY